MRKTGNLAIWRTFTKLLAVIEVTMLPPTFGLFVIIYVNLQTPESLTKFKQETGNTMTMAEQSNLKNIRPNKVVVALRCRF